MAKDSIPSDYAQRIKQLRAQHDLTQTRLAELIEVTPAAISQWESGTASPSLKRWQQIARAEALGIHALDVHAMGKAYGAIKEARAGYVVPEGPPELAFTTDAEIVQLVMQCQRLSYGYQTNPVFATEISQIHPLPHQRTAVYERMLRYEGRLRARLRFLLADDAGAGKTIMAGLLIREMLTRRLIRRVLVVPPAGLVGNWESEMHTLFSLPFRAVTGSDAQADNPFFGPESDLLIVSVDTLAGERMFSRLQEPDIAPYDLIIFDEAHKLSADREPDGYLRKTNRYRLAEALAGMQAEQDRWRLEWCAHHLLLLTATPHMGKDFPYYCLWRLLEPEILSTNDAFQCYPPAARRRHFIRRTKEEMIDFKGKPIYPRRVSDTLSYELTQGPLGEQRLYDEVTAYMQTQYNQAQMLNRSAARLAMSVFQRRLASSTYALSCSFENRMRKLEGLIASIQSGEIGEDELERRQHELDAKARDLLEESTADEEGGEGGIEEHEQAEDEALGGVVATNLAQLMAEHLQVQALHDMARQLLDNPAHEDAKFARLLEILRDPRYRDEKMILFTEHRDTLDFLARKLAQYGYTGEVAQIHGGMPYKEREKQVAFFRKPLAEGGARYLVGTDAAGEGINLQFCWLMANYDVPWNPARLEQRMGRIHRYGQAHDPVVILNLVAGQTREGKVIKTLLDKLETIGEALGHDKVFDVVGELLEGVSLKAYLERLMAGGDAERTAQEIDARVTQTRVERASAQRQARYGERADPRDDLERQQQERQIEHYRKLLPGNVRRFLERAAPMLGIAIDGDLDGYFALRPLETGALDPLWPVLETYSERQRGRLTVYRERAGKDDEALFVRPGEALFERLAGLFMARFGDDALRGGTFVDPLANEPYLFHLAQVEVMQAETRLESRLVGLRQSASGEVTVVPVEHLLLLRGGPPAYGDYLSLVARSDALRDAAQAYLLDEVTRQMVDDRRQALLADLPERSEAMRRGYDLREAELAARRTHYRKQADDGSPRAKAELARIKRQQQALRAQREAAIAALEGEPASIAPGQVTFVAHALVMPSDDPEEEKAYRQETEREAMNQAIAFEQSFGAAVRNVSTPQLAMEAGMEAHPGFDLISERPGGEIRLIEVKGRAGTSGQVELSYNELIKACDRQDAYWLYAVYGCATPSPFLWRVRNPFKKQLGGPSGSWSIDKAEIVQAAE
ncbi:MAG: DUF3883 domain-containing protein [Anaerolineae bacterium]|nr:DUF3883 domain-containing protein [Anaerolineae bacterium]